MKVYALGRAVLAFVIMLLVGSPLFSLMGPYAFGVGAVVALVFLMVTGAVDVEAPPGSVNVSRQMCVLQALILIVSVVGGLVALTRAVGHAWTLVGAALAVVTIAIVPVCAAMRVLPRARTEARRRKLAARLGWDYRLADADLIARLRKTFPEYGEIYGVLEGVQDEVSFTVGTVRPVWRARGRVWLVRLPVWLPGIEIKRGYSKSDLEKGMYRRTDEIGLITFGVSAGRTLLSDEVVAVLHSPGVADLRIQGKDLALRITGSARLEDEARIVAELMRALPLAAAAEQAEAGQTAASAGSGVAAQHADKDDDHPLDVAFGWGGFAAFCEIVFGILASIFDGFLPYGGLLIAVGVIMMVAIVAGSSAVTKRA